MESVHHRPGAGKQDRLHAQRPRYSGHHTFFQQAEAGRSKQENCVRTPPQDLNRKFSQAAQCHNQTNRKTWRWICQLRGVQEYEIHALGK
jgi:hypothetical protein